MPASIIGFGTMFVGERDYKPDGSYITTEFVTAFYLPLVPLRTFRAVEASHSFRWMGPSAGHARTSYRVQRRPLCWVQVGAIYGTLGLSIASLSLFLLAVGNRNNPGPMYGLYSHGVMWGIVLLLSATWPLILGRILRAKAKRQASQELIKHIKAKL